MLESIRESAEEMARVLAGRKAERVRVIDISGITVIADAFVVASGKSAVQTRALYDELREKAGPPRRCEGTASGRWIMMDYGDIVVHIFHREEREFYDLERLWDRGDNITDIE